VFAADSRLAPESPYPAAIDDAVAAYRGLLAVGTDPARVVVAGDSAGGGLALALLVRLRDAGEPLPAGSAVLAGDSAGGGLALSMALSMRDRGLAQATSLVMHAPWVDLTTSTPETFAADAIDPWLFIGKVQAYAAWWAGSADGLDRPEVSPALGDLTGLPRALMLYGTRDLLAPGCRLLARRGAEAGWDLTAIEEPDLIHVYGLLPFVPESARAFRQVTEFLR
jgi:acetyl esterase/lipase